ncbi:MAG: hypothetical protein M1546_08565 [Chloroflexi bacterium]|nr:hypothetical protein [Chloroflexota bacterium]
MSPSTRVLASIPLAAVKGAGSERRLAGIAELWSESIRVYGTHSAPILACALLGLAGSTLLGALVNAIVTLDIFVRTGGIFTNTSNIFYAQLLIQACFGTFAISLARGAIVWIALKSPSIVDGHAVVGLKSPVTLRAALRASARRWPVLLLSSLIYGALITLGIAGLTLLLRQMRLDVTSISRVNGDFDSMMRAVVVRAINGVTPDPGSPFTEMVSYARYLLRRSSTNYYWLYAYRYTLGEVPVRLWLIALTSLVPMIVTGTLLRLRVAAIMSASRPNQMAALMESVQLGARHFRYVAAHGMVVWLASVSLNIVFSLVPLTLAQYLVVPAVARALNTLWPYPVSALLFAAGAALVGMVFLAFGAVYDARLYRAMKGEGERRSRGDLDGE